MVVPVIWLVYVSRTVWRAVLGRLLLSMLCRVVLVKKAAPPVRSGRGLSQRASQAQPQGEQLTWPPGVDEEAEDFMSTWLQE